MPEINYRGHLSTLLDFIFPPACLTCKKSGNYLCLNCAELLPTPVSAAENEIAVFAYQHPIVKRAIRLLKYRGGRILARDLARLLQQYLSRNNFLKLEESGFLLVPIPASAGRRRQRGYNQAGELARELAALAPDKLELDENVLVKVRETISQVKTRNRQERLENLRGAFAVPAGAAARVAGKKILLVDDIITTGATMQEAERELRQAGAESILSLAIARG